MKLAKQHIRTAMRLLDNICLNNSKRSSDDEIDKLCRAAGDCHNILMDLK